MSGPFVAAISRADVRHRFRQRHPTVAFVFGLALVGHAPPQALRIVVRRRRGAETACSVINLAVAVHFLARTEHRGELATVGCQGFSIRHNATMPVL